MNQKPLRQSVPFIIALGGLMCCIVAVAVFGAWELLISPPYDSAFHRLFPSVCLVGFFFLVSTGAAAVGRRGAWLASMSIAVGVHAMGMAAVLVLIWFEDSLDRDMDEALLRFGIGTLAVATATIHMGVMCRLPGRTVSMLIMRILTIGCVSLLCAVLVVAVIDEQIIEYLFDVLAIDEWILLSMFSMLALGGLIGTALTPVMSITSSRRQHRSEWLTRRVTLELTCPRCGSWQQAGQGYSRCTSCRAVLRVELEEPRCACGYLLYELHGRTCPECGRAIDSQDVTPASAGVAPPTAPPVIDEPKQSGA